MVLTAEQKKRRDDFLFGAVMPGTGNLNNFSYVSIRFLYRSDVKKDCAVYYPMIEYDRNILWLYFFNEHNMLWFRSVI